MLTRRTPLRRHKLNARAVRVDGRSFGSGDEARRGAELQLLERAGEIRDLRFQVVFLLAGTTSYRADFTYTETATGRDIVEDFKGYEKGASGERWRMVKKQWGLWGDFVLRVTKRAGRGFIVTEEILPQPQARVEWMRREIDRLTTETHVSETA